MEKKENRLLLFLPLVLVALPLLLWAGHLFGVLPQTSLFGYFPSDEPVAVSYDSVMTGSYQRHYEKQFTSSFPSRNVFVKLYNQLYTSVLKTSPNDQLVLGRNGTLFERSYLEEYCFTNPQNYGENNRAVLADHAADLAVICDWAAAEGKDVWVYITPSKAVFCEEDIPWQYAAGKDRAALHNIDVLKQELIAAGVPFFDAAEQLLSVQDHLPYTVFPNSGTHWRGVAGDLAFTMFTEQFNTTANNRLPPLHFGDSAVEPMPLEAVDIDLYKLLNVIDRVSVGTFVRDQYYSRTARPDIPEEGDRVALFLQGGSFQKPIHETYLDFYPQALDDAVFIHNTVVLSLHDEFWSVSEPADFPIEQILDKDILIFEVNQEAAVRMGFGFATKKRPDGENGDHNSNGQ